MLRLVKVLRLLKVLRMARLTKLPSLMPKVEWLLNRPMTQMAIMCGACCVMLHWIACAWYYTAMAAEDGGWVTANSLVSGAIYNQKISVMVTRDLVVLEAA